jgi:glucokinase
MSTSEFTVGLDLGGTHIKAALVGRDGAVARFEKFGARAHESLEATLDAMEEAARAVSDGARVRGLGVGCPGAVDPESGTQRGSTPNLPHWVDVPVRDLMAARLGWPAAADNDANLAALGEARCGAGRGGRCVAMVTLGTGVGGGLVTAGRVWRGAHGGAGEIGHVVVAPDGAECACGRRGCVEAYASAGGMERRARKALDAGVNSVLGNGEPIAPERIFAAAEAGDPLAGSLLAGAARALGAGLAILIHVADPDVIVLGGGVALAGRPLLDRVRAALDSQVLPSHRGTCRVVLAELGERGGAVGAGLWAWESLGDG